MAAVQCNLDIPKVPGLEDHQLTVGREFYLTCKGEWPKTLKKEALYFTLEKAGSEVKSETLKYHIKLLDFEFRSLENVDIKITSYLAGQHQFPNLILTDGERKLELGPVQFSVQSVLEQGQQQKQEKVEPFGPMGPATIAVPVLYWVILFGTLVLMGTLGALKIWRHNQRREMLLRLKEHDSALSPLQEFHQSMRRLQRANPVFFGKEATSEELRQGVTELSRMFKVFISRRLKVPAFEWNERLIVNDLRRYHFFVHQEYSQKIRSLFLELHRAESANAKLTSHDVSQLAESLRKTLEGIEKLMDREQMAQKGDR
ncbi:MAG TPA: hypothetical protein VIG33_07390 [Pseudobdellovibrionaceae bacterium]|jgi:hypothetical protein